MPSEQNVVKKDWTGDYNSIYRTIGASNHTDKERELNDYYATEGKAIPLLLEVEQFNKNIYEPACGGGHLSRELEKAGYNVLSTDLVDRGYGQGGIDFLQRTEIFNGDIITNPPYKYAQQFIEHALEIIPKGNKVAMFLKLTFLEGKNRKQLFTSQPPKVLYVSSSRLLCAKNGEFQKMKENGGSAVAYGWFVWEKGFQGHPMIKWIN